MAMIALFVGAIFHEFSRVNIQVDSLVLSYCSNHWEGTMFFCVCFGFPFSRKKTFKKINGFLFYFCLFFLMKNQVFQLLDSSILTFAYFELSVLLSFFAYAFFMDFFELRFQMED